MERRPGRIPVPKNRRPPRSPAAPRVLVAEAHDHVGRLIRDTLLLAGFSVELFRDGAEALKKYRPGTYCLMILDRLMPGKSGMEFLGMLRDRGDRVPILLLAGRSGRADRLDAQAYLYRFEVLWKPFGVSELRAAVNRLSPRDPS